MKKKFRHIRFHLLVIAIIALFITGAANYLNEPLVKLVSGVYPEPPVVQLASAQAIEMIEREWNLQLGSRSYGEACREELTRAERILKRQAGKLDADELEKRERSLDRLKSMLSGEAADSSEIYSLIRKFKRDIMLSDPGIDFSGVVCIDNPYVHGSEQVHEIRSRTENTATLGGRLLYLEGMGPDARVRKLAPEGRPAAFYRPDVSFDGKRVLFCMKQAGKTSYNLYEVGVDGQGYKQITESDYNDLDPVYSPDGGIIFSTSRCNQYLRCGGSAFRMFILARSDINGNNIYFISANNEADFTPAFLPDGRILYTRWEYIDKSVFRIQSLWTVNPDGTNMNIYYGNQSKWPDMLLNARHVPNTGKVIFNAAGHHDILAGPLGVIEQDEGMNYPDGVYNLTPHIPWAEVGKGPADRVYNPDFSAPDCYIAFQTPYPINEDLFLVSARKGSIPRTKRNPELDWFDLFLMDYDGNMELLYTGEYNIFFAQPVRPRPVPRVIPTTVKWPGRMEHPGQQAEWGVLYSADVYEGSGIPRGMVKSLRILEAEPQTQGHGRRVSGRMRGIYCEAGAYPEKFPPCGNWGEVPVSLVMDDATKRIWGTVPVEEDGSVNFKVPPVTGLYFQLLDENGRALQTMRSLTHAMPGEVRGCVGCHSTKAVSPPLKPSLATRRAPSEIAPPFWGDETISFTRFVQPVLDAHCIRCHGGNEPAGGLNLTHRTEPGASFSWPYVSLVFGEKPAIWAEWADKTIAGMVVPGHVYPNDEVEYPTHETVIPPMTTLSYRSRLIDIATTGKHHGVKVSPEEEMRLVAWVDALCPYMGLEDVIAQPDPDPDKYLSTKSYKGLSFPAKMRTAPYVHKAFMQDEFKTQDDRIPKDRDGKPVPSFELIDGKRIYRIP